MADGAEKALGADAVASRAAAPGAGQAAVVADAKP